jgi:hypothetical protein
MLPPVVPLVEPPMLLPVDPLVEPPTELPVEPPGVTAPDVPLPSVPLPVAPLEPPTLLSACPGGTPVRDAELSLLPGVRPPARDAALPLLPGERSCIASLPCILSLSVVPLVPPLCMELPDDPVVLPVAPVLAANDRPDTPSDAAMAMAKVVFLI